MLTTLEKVDFLQKVPTFRAVATESLARLAAIAQEVCFDARQRLFSENEAAETMFVLLEGEVALVRNGQEVKKLGADQVVGLLALLAGDSQPESAVAIQPTRALRVDQQDFFDIMAEDFDITLGIIKAVVNLAVGRA